VSGIDLPPIPFPVDALHDAKAILVAGRPAVGFVQVGEVDGLAHIEALAVIPGAMRRGVGTALLEAACTWARTTGYPAITLVTFADVSWNAPFCAARGFVEAGATSPGIAELLDWERAVGLDAVGRRIVMRRDL
jgi:GNAT superfamily N-acetyltransferase